MGVDSGVAVEHATVGMCVGGWRWERAQRARRRREVSRRRVVDVADSDESGEDELVAVGGGRSRSVT